MFYETYVLEWTYIQKLRFVETSAEKQNMQICG